MALPTYNYKFTAKCASGATKEVSFTATGWNEARAKLAEFVAAN